MTYLPPPIESRLRQLPKGLRDHIQRTREIARELGQIHQLDLELIDLAAASHDIARANKAKALLEEAKRLGLTIHPVDKELPVLLHGPVATRWLQDAGVQDPRVLEAVHWHSTANRGLGPIAKVVFLADKLDPEKVRRYPYLETVRGLAHSASGGLDHQGAQPATLLPPRQSRRAGIR